MITYIALGTNLEDRAHNLARARALLNAQVTIINVSGIYETEPWGVTDQPKFLNQVVQGDTKLSALDLLRFIKSIERAMGRRETFRYGPRLIDLDILLFGELILNAPNLVIPHPRMVERAFVLAPLAEIASSHYIPGTGLTVAQALAPLDTSGIRKLEKAE